MEEYDLIILGTGPAGLEIEMMLGDPTKKICMIDEQASTLGGVCVNTGCMPTKYLTTCAEILETAERAKEFSIQIPGVSMDFCNIVKCKQQMSCMLRNLHRDESNAEIIYGHARFVENKIIEITKENGEKERVTAEEIVIATGSRPRSIPNIAFDGQYICTSDDIQNIDTVPKTLLIVGGGVIGLEFASIFKTFGSDVTVIEAAPMILPNEDMDTGMLAKELFEKNSIDVHTNTCLNSAKVSNHQVVCEFSGETLASGSYDRVLIAIGRIKNTDDLGLENTDITTTKGSVDVNEYLETSVPKVYAAGDIIPTMMLAHSAVYESLVITSNMKKSNSMKNINRAVPRVVFSNPEIAGVGLTEKEAKELYGDIKVINFPMLLSGMNMITHQTDGRLKLIFSGTDLVLIGASIIGRLATELIHELTLAVTYKMTFYDLKNMIHAHPSTSEVIWFSVLKGMLLDSTECFIEMMKDKDSQSSSMTDYFRTAAQNVYTADCMKYRM